MSKEEALKLIDDHKNKLINPIDLLNWTWLRVTIAQLSDEAWEACTKDAATILSK